KFHIFQRDAAAVTDGPAVARQAVGIVCRFPELAPTTCRKDHAFALEDVQVAAIHVDRHESRHRAVVHDPVYHVIFVEENHVGVDTLLIQRWQTQVAGAVSSMAGPPNWFTRFVIGMPAEASL